MIALNVDASFREDLHKAGIAFCAPFGHSMQVVEAHRSMEAELLALVLAMSAVHARGIDAATFRYDAPLDFRRTVRDNWKARRVVRKMLAAHPNWNLKQIPRQRNVEANVLARRALKLAVGNPWTKRSCRAHAKRERLAA